MTEETRPKKASPLKDAVIDVLKEIYDPEIPVNIYDLGLIYDVAIEDAGEAYVKMTLTSPMCPVAGSMPGQVEKAVKAVDGVSAATVDLVWEPAWTPDLMTEAAKLELGM